MKLYNRFFAYKRVLEALKSVSEAEFELSVKKRILLMVQTMFGDIFDKNLRSSSSLVIVHD